MQVSFRIPETMAKAIDQVAERRSASSGGVPINRTQIVLLALREWLAHEQQRATLEKEQEGELRRDAIRLGMLWARKFARPAEKKLLTQLMADTATFVGQLDASIHGWWDWLSQQLPSLGKVSKAESEIEYNGKTIWTMPDVGGEVLVFLTDEEAMRDFCAFFAESAYQTIVNAK